MYISTISAPNVAPKAAAVVSLPPRPNVVTSPVSVTPWKPATTATFPSDKTSRIRLGSIFVIRASVWLLSVLMPA